MAFTEDFDAFFGSSEVTSGFAVAATYTPDGGDPSTIYGIFDDEYFDEVGGVGIEGSAPAFHCEAADVSGVAQGDALTVNSVSYIIRNVRPDGTGYVVLILEEQ